MTFDRFCDNNKNTENEVSIYDKWIFKKLKGLEMDIFVVAVFVMAGVLGVAFKCSLRTAETGILTALFDVVCHLLAVFVVLPILAIVMLAGLWSIFEIFTLLVSIEFVP